MSRFFKDLKDTASFRKGWKSYLFWSGLLCAGTYASHKIYKSLTRRPFDHFPKFVDLKNEERFEDFFEGKMLRTSTNMSAASGSSSVCAYELHECIGVFAVEYKDLKREEILTIQVWHANEHTISGDFGDERKWDGDYKADSFESLNETTLFYIIGGNEITTKSENGLLCEIKKAIISSFDTDDVIVQELTNKVDKRKDFRYVTAALGIDGKLGYYVHR